MAKKTIEQTRAEAVVRWRAYYEKNHKKINAKKAAARLAARQSGGVAPDPKPSTDPVITRARLPLFGTPYHVAHDDYYSHTPTYKAVYVVTGRISAYR